MKRFCYDPRHDEVCEAEDCQACVVECNPRYWTDKDYSNDPEGLVNFLAEVEPKTRTCPRCGASLTFDA